MLIKVGIASSFALLASLIPVRAAVVDFNDLGSQSPYFSTTSFSDEGASLVYTHETDGFAIIGEPSCTPKCSNDGTPAFYSYNYGSLSFSLGGTAFSLSQFDAAQTFTTMDRPLALSVVGTTASGATVTDTFTALPGAADSFQTFSTDPLFTDLTSVTFSGIGLNPTSEFALDNITYALVSPVPLPASAPAFAAALLVLGVVSQGLKRGKATAAR